MPTTTHDPDDRLSRCASALFALMRELDAAEGDVAAFGAPSECYAVCIHRAERDAQRILTSYGFTSESFEQTLASRVDAYWLYKSGLCATPFFEEGN